MHVLSSFQRTGRSSRTRRSARARRRTERPPSGLFSSGEPFNPTDRLRSCQPPLRFFFRSLLSATPHPKMLLALSLGGVCETREAARAESRARNSNYTIRNRRCQPPRVIRRLGPDRFKRAFQILKARRRRAQAQPFVSCPPSPHPARHEPHPAFPPEARIHRPVQRHPSKPSRR